ncbi:phospholipase A2 [Lentithecium fluviatile CBS 122367]|uniref:Phospholipase A2 n=1 Tax=Lentithecium fluviatile CBS 122367 TaxID=1168545 RepID=A0A6G1J623_9PLEO|nr:phospholipase A2 [Lentithecium fluviatile CBS 122367]
MSTDPLFAVLPACYRHDFGYRNYKKQSRFDEINRERIDNNFREDLYRQCESEWSEHICKIAATIYYEAVRAFGNTQAAQDVKEIREALKALKVLQAADIEARVVKTLATRA